MVLGDPETPKAVYCKGGRFTHETISREIPDMQAITFDYGSFAMTCESGSFTDYTKFSHEVRYGKTGLSGRRVLAAWKSTGQSR